MNNSINFRLGFAPRIRKKRSTSEIVRILAKFAWLVFTLGIGITFLKLRRIFLDYPLSLFGIHPDKS